MINAPALPPLRESRNSRNLYRGHPIDNNVPSIPPSQLLSIPSSRPGRRLRANPVDPIHLNSLVIQSSKRIPRLYESSSKTSKV